MERTEIGHAPVTAADGSRVRWLMLAAAWLAQTIVYVAAQASAPVAPLIQDDLHITRAEVGVFASAFSVGVLVTLIPAGWLSDRIGVRLLFLIGPGLVGLLLIAVSRAGSFLGIVLALLVAGLGGGMTSPATTKAVVNWFAAKTRGTAMGIKQTGTSAGGAIAAALAPALALAWGWRPALGLIGFALLIAAILCFVFYRDYPAPKIDPSSAPRLSLWAVLANRDIQLSSLAAVCFTAVQFILVTYLVLYLKEVMAMSLAVAGGLLALAQIGGVLGRIVLGIASDRLLGGRRKGLLVLTGIIALASATVVALAAPSLSAAQLTMLVFVFGLAGIGWTGIFMTLISELSGKESTGVGSAVGLFACNLGILLGPPLFGLLVDHSHSYLLGWMMVGLIAALGTLLVLPVRERRI